MINLTPEEYIKLVATIKSIIYQYADGGEDVLGQTDISIQESKFSEMAEKIANISAFDSLPANMIPVEVVNVEVHRDIAPPIWAHFTDGHTYNRPTEGPIGITLRLSAGHSNIRVVNEILGVAAKGGTPLYIGVTPQQSSSTPGGPAIPTAVSGTLPAAFASGYVPRLQSNDSDPDEDDENISPGTYYETYHY